MRADIHAALLRLEAEGLSQRKIARRAGLAQSAVNVWLGRTHPHSRYKAHPTDDRAAARLGLPDSPTDKTQPMNQAPVVTTQAEGAHVSVTVVSGNGPRNPEEAAEQGYWDPADTVLERWRCKPYEGHQTGPDGNPVIVKMTSLQMDFVPREAGATQFEPVRPVSIPAPALRTRRPKPSGLHTALVFGDRQYGFVRDERTGHLEPMHDRRAIDAVVQLAAYLNPDRLIDLGDVLDLAEWSTKFVREPSYSYTTQASLVEAAYDNARLRRAAPDAEFDLLEGNHDRRIEDYLLANAKAAHGLRAAAEVHGPALYSLPYLLGLEAQGIRYAEGYPDGEVWINDGLKAIHGTVAKSKSGQTAAALVAEHQESVMQGHGHRYEAAHRTVWHRGKPKTIRGVMCAALCRIDGAVPGVKKRQNWQQGALVVHYDPAGSFHRITPVEIEDGRAYYDGRFFEGEADAKALSSETGYAFERGGEAPL